jgi:hypothetical protein
MWIYLIGAGGGGEGNASFLRSVRALSHLDRGQRSLVIWTNMESALTLA